MLPAPDSPPARSAEVLLSPELELSVSPFNHHSVSFSSAPSIQNLVPSLSNQGITSSLDTVFCSSLQLELLTGSSEDSNHSVPGLGPDDNSIPVLGPDEISTSDLELIDDDSDDNQSNINQLSQSEIINTEQSMPETLAPSNRSRGRPCTQQLPDPNAPKHPRGRPKKDQGVQDTLDDAGPTMSSSEITGDERSANKQKKYKKPQLRDPDAPHGPAFTSVSAWVSSASRAPQSPPPQQADLVVPFVMD